MLCWQPKPFVGVSEGSHSSCSHLVNKRAERFWESSLVRAGNINQAYNVAKRSLLCQVCGWLSFSLWGRSITRVFCRFADWGKPRLPAADMERSCSFLWFVSSHASAFGDKQLYHHRALEQITACFFFFSLKTVTLVQYVLFPVVEMAWDLTYLWTCLIDLTNNSLRSFPAAFYVVDSAPCSTQ